MATMVKIIKEIKPLLPLFMFQSVVGAKTNERKITTN